MSTRSAIASLGSSVLVLVGLVGAGLGIGLLVQGGSYVLVPVGSYVLAHAGSYAAGWIAPESTWAYEFQYSFDDDLKYATVSVGRKPHDCEFLSVPLGLKHCHYQKRVLTTRVRRDESGIRRVSYDEGKTWAPAAASIEPVVFVMWERIED